MAFVVCEPCRGCRYTDCVVVCPVEAFYAAGDMLVIDPDSCICCGACVPECPVEAIHDEQDLPAVWAEYAQRNAEGARAAKAAGAGPVVEKLVPLKPAGN